MPTSKSKTVKVDALALADAEAYAQRLRDDFWFFLNELWTDRDLHSKHPLGWVEKEVTDWVVNGPRELGVLSWRLWGKTFILCAAYPLWLLLRDPDTKILVVSKSAMEVKKTLHLTKSWLRQVWFLNHMAPKTRVIRKRDTTEQFDVVGAKPARDPSYSVKGVDGQLQGLHATVVIADDIETDNNTATRDARELLLGVANNFTAIRYEQGGRVIYIGTFNTEESVYMKLDKQGTPFRTWPLVYPEPSHEHLGLAPSILEAIGTGAKKPGEIVAPYRIDQRFVDDRKAKGPRWFGMQYELRTDLRQSIKYPLSLSNLMVLDHDKGFAPSQLTYSASDEYAIPESEIPCAGWTGDRLYRPSEIPHRDNWTKFQQSALFVDPAGSGGDRIGVAYGSSLNGFIFVHHVDGLIGGPSDHNCEQIAALAYHHRARTCYIEGNFGGDALGNLIQVHLNRLVKHPGHKDCPEGWGCSVVPIWSAGQKEKRIIAALETPFAAHRMILSTTAASNMRLQHQISRITYDRNCLEHEDELDAVAGLTKELLPTLALDPSRILYDARRKAVEDAISRIDRSASEGSSWNRRAVATR